MTAGTQTAEGDRGHDTRGGIHTSPAPLILSEPHTMASHLRQIAVVLK